MYNEALFDKKQELNAWTQIDNEASRYVKEMDLLV